MKKTDIRRSHDHVKGRFLIDDIACMSSLRKVSPFLKIAVALSSIIVCVIFKSVAVSVYILVSMIFFILTAGKTKVHDIAALMAVPAGFTVLGCLMIAVEISTEEHDMICSFCLGKYTIGLSDSSVLFSIKVFLQCLASVSCMYFLSLTTPMTELFTALRCLYIPSFLIEISELMYRYIFVLMETAVRIKSAQECRLGYRNIRTGIYSSGQLIANLFMRAYSQAERTYTAMESRGYNGEVKTLGIEYHTPLKFIIGSSVYAILLAIIVIMFLRGVFF